MKLIHTLTILLFLSVLSTANAQNAPVKSAKHSYPVQKLTIEPAIGFNPSSMSNVLASNIVQWNVQKRLSVISYTAYAYNNAFSREFNHITTEYNYSLMQKFGIGTSLYGKRASHTFSLMAGIKYDAFKETLTNPELEPASASINSTSPDVGLMYNWKLGKGKFFFSYRMYLPIYPYPFKTTDFWSLDGNIGNITMEFGLGIRLK